MFLAFLGAAQTEAFHAICYYGHYTNPCVCDQTCLYGFGSGRELDDRSDDGLQSRIDALFYDELLYCFSVHCLMEDVGDKFLGLGS